MSVALDHATQLVVDPAQSGDEPLATTLLELVEAVSDGSNNEREVVATVAHMLRSGRVKLTGCLRDAPLWMFRI